MEEEIAGVGNAFVCGFLFGLIRPVVIELYLNKTVSLAAFLYDKAVQKGTRDGVELLFQFSDFGLSLEAKSVV